MITNKTKNSLNHGGPAVGYTFGKKNLGTHMQNTTKGFAKHLHICKKLVSADITAGVVTITLDGEYDSVGGVFVLNSGAPRVITKVEIAKAGDVYSLKVTATSVAADDYIHADVYLTA